MKDRGRERERERESLVLFCLFFQHTDFPHHLSCHYLFFFFLFSLTDFLYFENLVFFSHSFFSLFNQVFLSFLVLLFFSSMKSYTSPFVTFNLMDTLSHFLLSLSVSLLSFFSVSFSLRERYFFLFLLCLSRFGKGISL